MIKTIKQSRNNSCLAAVLAMMVNESEEYVLDWFKFQNTPLNDEDAFIFLAHHGIYLSLYCLLNEPQSICKTETLEIDISLNDRKMYLVVESENYPGKHHAVFWDGNCVHDPSPNSQDKRSIEEYKIIGFYPIMTTKEREILKWESK